MRPANGSIGVIGQYQSFISIELAIRDRVGLTVGRRNLEFSSHHEITVGRPGDPLTKGVAITAHAQRREERAIPLTSGFWTHDARDQTRPNPDFVHQPQGNRAM